MRAQSSMLHVSHGAFWLTCIAVATGSAVACAPSPKPPPVRSGVITETGPVPPNNDQFPSGTKSEQAPAATERPVAPQTSSTADVVRPPTITIVPRSTGTRRARETEDGRLEFFDAKNSPPSNPASGKPPAVVRDANGRIYTGPESGVISWPTRLEKGDLVTIVGRLPGVPVAIKVKGSEFEIVERPAAETGWNRFSLRSRARQVITAEIHWVVLR